MSTSALENEDLENVPLVRMEDVQPSRTFDLISRRRSDGEVLETCVIEDIEYDNECIVNDDEDSNIGSMISIQSEDVVEEEDSEAEMIVPEMIDESSTANSVLEPITKYQGITIREDDDKKAPSSWPTLEILPGGVIKKPEKWDETLDHRSSYDEGPKPEEMMYACAKCPQRFKFLFCLVKHVKWHEDEAKKLDSPATEIKPKQNSRVEVCTHIKKRKVMIHAKPHKKKTPKKLKS